MRTLEKIPDKPLQVDRQTTPGGAATCTGAIEKNARKSQGKSRQKVVRITEEIECI